MPSLNTGNAILSNAIAVNSSYNVGIGGAASGTNKLQVTGIASANSFIPTSSTIPSNGMYLPSANTLGFSTNSSLDMVITAAGNVGIGTSNPTPRDAGALVLELYGTSSGRSSLKFTNSTSGTGATDGMWMGYDDGLNFTMVNNEAGYIALATSNTERMRITSGGNVGIGTTIPSGIVNGSGLVIYDSLYPRLILQNSTTGTSTSAYSGMYMVGNNMYVQNPLANLYLGTLAGSTVMTLSNDGNVGIGTSTFPNTLSKSIDLVNGGGMFGLNNQLYLTANAYYNSQWLYKNTSGAAIINLNATNGSINFVNAPSGAAGSTINFTTKFVIDSDGSIANPTHPTTANAANVHMTVGGTFYRSTSSLKYKNSVTDYDKGLDIVNQLRPVYYKGNNDGDTMFAGLIAEEVHDLGLTEFVQYAEDGSPEALAYPNMIALAFKAIQEQQAQIEAQQQTINSLINR